MAQKNTEYAKTKGAIPGMTRERIKLIVRALFPAHELEHWTMKASHFVPFTAEELTKATQEMSTSKAYSTTSASCTCASFWPD